MFFFDVFWKLFSSFWKFLKMENTKTILFLSTVFQLHSAKASAPLCYDFCRISLKNSRNKKKTIQELYETFCFFGFWEKYFPCGTIFLVNLLWNFLKKRNHEVRSTECLMFLKRYNLMFMIFCNKIVKKAFFHLKLLPLN